MLARLVRITRSVRLRPRGGAGGLVGVALVLRLRRYSPHSFLLRVRLERSGLQTSPHHETSRVAKEQPLPKGCRLSGALFSREAERSGR